jgi:hypothetical protein
MEVGYPVYQTWTWQLFAPQLLSCESPDLTLDYDQLVPFLQTTRAVIEYVRAQLVRFCTT